MPPEDHGCQYEHDNVYDMNQSRAPGRLCGRHFRRRHCQTRSEPEIEHDYSEEPQDNTASKNLAYRPRPRQHSMSPRQGGSKAEKINSGEPLAEYLNGKQRRELALE